MAKEGKPPKGRPPEYDPCLIGQHNWSGETKHDFTYVTYYRKKCLRCGKPSQREVRKTGKKKGE